VCWRPVCYLLRVCMLHRLPPLRPKLLTELIFSLYFLLFSIAERLSGAAAIEIWRPPPRVIRLHSRMQNREQIQRENQTVRRFCNTATDRTRGNAQLANFFCFLAHIGQWAHEIVNKNLVFQHLGRLKRLE